MARNLLARKDSAEDKEMIKVLVLRKALIELSKSKINNFPF